MLFKNKIYLFTLLYLVINTVLYSQQLPKFIITTENWKPFQYIENNEIKGISVDVMDIMLQYLDSEQNRDDIKILPWSRAYKNALNNDDTILFLMARTEERENLFKWVGPLLDYKNYLIAKKDQHIILNSLEDLTKYKIGSVKDDASETYLMNLGVPFDNLVRAQKGSDVVNILYKERIQILLSEWSSFESDIEYLNLDINDFEPIYVASESELFYAFSVTTPDEIINRFQKSLNLIEESGKFIEIFNNYDYTDIDFIQ